MCSWSTRRSGRHLPPGGQGKPGADDRRGTCALHARTRFCWNSAARKGYSGTLTLVKDHPVTLSTGLGIDRFDHEGRTMTNQALGTTTVTQVGIIVADIEAKAKAWADVLDLPIPDIIITAIANTTSPL
jgi:hypothetical protein